jgi:hypothetical protein
MTPFRHPKPKAYLFPLVSPNRQPKRNARKPQQIWPFRPKQHPKQNPIPFRPFRPPLLLGAERNEGPKQKPKGPLPSRGRSTPLHRAIGRNFSRLRFGRRSLPSSRAEARRKTASAEATRIKQIAGGLSGSVRQRTLLHTKHMRHAVEIVR